MERLSGKSVFCMLEEDLTSSQIFYYCTSTILAMIPSKYKIALVDTAFALFNLISQLSNLTVSLFSCFSPRVATVVSNNKKYPYENK